MSKSKQRKNSAFQQGRVDAKKYGALMYKQHPFMNVYKKGFYFEMKKMKRMLVR